VAPSLVAGDIVVMDNLSSHKGTQVAKLVESAGATVLYLYSPDLNSIEMAFSKIKQLMRAAEHRTREALWSNMQQLLDQITPSDSPGFFRYCGYAIQGK
jgi:transposase